MVFRRRCVLSNAISIIFRINMVFRRKCVLSNAIIAIFRINIVFTTWCVLSNALIVTFRINMVSRTGRLMSRCQIVTGPNIRKNLRISIVRIFSPKSHEFSTKSHEYSTKSQKFVRVQSQKLTLYLVVLHTNDFNLDSMRLLRMELYRVYTTVKRSTVFSPTRT